MNKTVLDNGLTLFTLANPAVPLVTLDMWVRVGSKDEPAGIAGVSHFLEHMMFKGTPRLPVGEYDRRIEGLGGYLNAATSSDYTHYYMVLPSEKLGAALVDLADVMVNSSIDPDEVESERQVILEEIRQKQDNPVGFLYDEVTRRAYVSSPYANTVIGSSETVAAMSREQLLSHYHRHYAPANMALMVVGDIDEKAVVEQARALFDGFDRPLEPWSDNVPGTVFREPETVTWERDWQQTYFFLTYPGGAAGTLAEMAAADVADTLLFGGRSSRLVNALREKRRLVTSISGLWPTHVHPGFLALYGTCDPDKLEAVQDALYEEIDRIVREGIPASELAKAKRQIIVHHLYHSETNTGKAGMMGYSFSLFGDTRLVNEYPAAIEEVTEARALAEIRRIARDRASLYVARPAAASGAR